MLLLQGSFNGAVTLSLQKYWFYLEIPGACPPLQWSCNFIVTEIWLMNLEIIYVCMLQWSCNFIVTEIVITQARRDEVYDASMEL